MIILIKKKAVEENIKIKPKNDSLLRNQLNSCYTEKSYAKKN